MIRILIVIVLIAHGIGHVLGVFPALGLASLEGWSLRSWLLTDLIGTTAASWLGVVLWLVGLLGFVGAGLGMLGWIVPQAWWRSLAISAAVLSLLALALYWNAFPSLLNKVGAIGVDVAVLVGLLWLNWPSEAVLAS